MVNDTIGAALLIAGLFETKKENYAIVANNLYAAQRIYEFLLNFFPEEEVVFFPCDELLRAEAISSSHDLLSQRLYAMEQLLSDRKKILVTHPAGLLRYLPDPSLFQKSIIKLKKGDKVDLDDLKFQLSELGYKRVNKIDQSLQFASRGDVFDVFSVSSLTPFRIELFDDEIESIRSFDIATQNSVSEVESITILPATDFLLNDDELTKFATSVKEELEKERSSLDEANSSLLSSNVTNDLEHVVGKDYRPNLYKYYSYALGEAHSILEYFSPVDVFITSKEDFSSSCQKLIQESESFLLELSNDHQIIRGLSYYMDIDKALSNPKIVSFGDRFLKDPGNYQLNVMPIVPSGNGISAILPTLASYISTDEKTIIALAEPHQRATVSSILKDAGYEFEEVEGYELPHGKIGLSNASLNVGFEIGNAKIAYVSSSELFGHRVNGSRFTARFKEATILKTYEELRPGDYVVHEYNGIGQFLGIKTLENDGVHRDYLHIAYAGNQTLYVPLEQFRLVRKYSGREGVAPKLSHLSGSDWKKKKAHIEERVNELADRLIALYGTRAKIAGFAFPSDDELQEKFEDEFPHELTADQAKAIAEVKADMERPEVMDRLLCGDVGFGKTEVAFRACFKAIDAHKQAAILCPTTLLARQHYEVALERFSSFGIHIALFSRLVPESIQRANMKALKEGKIDLVIGTHRLLSKEIEFKDLGLLVIDEEQRFGVEQKEKIKELKNSVDVLSLSATPIPRTLQMSLVGIRPLSEINTAPSTRMPIQTYVTPYNASTIYELIGRELSRDGQVFYVHNRVDSIYRRADEIAHAVDNAKVGVVHGKMEKAEIEETMERFYDNDLNVLVATSIIENGIDVPNANMLIVEDADHFGLSQLYQIKGRVGRGDRIAYAYLFYKPNKSMNEDAQKRLEAIQEFTELGSGYKIAQRDLLIRGAGDMLGPEQAGFIDTVGLDLYLKMLNEAIEEKKTGVKKEAPKAKSLFSIDAYIPADYATSSDKIALYQELEDASSEAEVKKIVKHMKDVYGKPPQEVLLLIQKKKIDLVVESDEFVYVRQEGDYIDILLSESFSRKDGIGLDLFNALTPFLHDIQVNFLEKKLRIRLRKNEGWIQKLETIVKTIHALSLRVSHN